MSHRDLERRMREDANGRFIPDIESEIPFYEFLESNGIVQHISAKFIFRPHYVQAPIYDELFHIPEIYCTFLIELKMSFLSTKINISQYAVG